jgi:SSS family solute:Na+ symporter
MSSGDAIVHAAGSVLIKDGYRVLVRSSVTDADETRMIRWAVVGIGGIAYYVAISSEISLVLLLLLSYGFIAQIFPALIAALCWRRSTPAGVIAGLAVGCLATIIWNLAPALQWQQIHPGIWGLAANTAVLIAVSFATRPMNPAHVDEFVTA